MTFKEKAFNVLSQIKIFFLQKVTFCMIQHSGCNWLNAIILTFDFVIG
jgi:hypothetical protein